MAGENEIKRRITLHLYDTDLQVTIPPADEEMFRKGAKLITDVVNTYSAKMKGQRSDKEILYMALVDIAIRYERETMRTDVAPFNELLSKLTSEIEDALK